MNYITENNAERPATKKQLWALYCLTKKDYRGQDLTMLDASTLLSRLNGQKVEQAVIKKNERSLENEFISFMENKIEGVISVARQAIKIKSIVEDDPSLQKKDSKKFAFFGFGCGISVIEFDKRSKVGNMVKELSAKHHMTTFLKMFLGGFTKEEVKYFEKVGFPLQAMYCQDIRIGAQYEQAVASFMEKKGVKNVRVKTYYD